MIGNIKATTFMGIQPYDKTPPFPSVYWGNSVNKTDNSEYKIGLIYIARESLYYPLQC